MGIGMVEDVVSAGDKHSKNKQSFILQPRSCGLLLFSCSEFYHEDFFQLVFYSFSLNIYIAMPYRFLQ
jgi:hypothetical protein